MPVSYTHLDVYKRQELESAYVFLNLMYLSVDLKNRLLPWATSMAAMGWVPLYLP